MPPPEAGVTTLSQKVEALERREIAAALQQHGGNRSRAAQMLGLSRQGLLKKMDCSASRSYQSDPRYNPFGSLTHPQHFVFLGDRSLVRRDASCPKSPV